MGDYTALSAGYIEVSGNSISKNQTPWSSTNSQKLEYGKNFNGVLLAVPLNQIKVVKTSYVVKNGYCFIGKTALDKGQKPFMIFKIR